MPRTKLGCQLLVVEKNPNTFRVMREHLTRAEYQVHHAESGWEALRELRQQHIDIIISEYDISDMDGSSFREKVLLDPATRDTPFLFLSEEGAQNEIQALRSGVDDYIVKPFDPVVLVARVQAVISRRQTYEEMVRVDALTRLLNRHALEQDLDLEIARLVRYQRKASMLYLDIDGYAKLNADHGASLGDLMLTCLSGIITTSIRTMDIAGRYRGDSFILYLPETDEQGAQILAERILARIEELSMSLAGVKVSFSAGIVGLPWDGDTFQELLTKAQETAAIGKQEGKPKVNAFARAFPEEA